MSTFDAGDHVKVKRLLYTHHGIYVNDCRVIDFSGGRNILEKRNALVQARTLTEFEGTHRPAIEVLPDWAEESRRLLPRARICGAEAIRGERSIRLTLPDQEVSPKCLLKHNARVKRRTVRASA